MSLQTLASSLAAAWALLLTSTLLAQVPRDPATQDPPRITRTAPGGIEELKIPMGGTRVNGLLYRAQGAGSHPAIVLLHGFPGNERNLDLAQALRRAGYHVLYFNYRGSWGSGGNFSFTAAHEDVASALAFLRAHATVERYGIDPKRIHLIGHSMGGWLALAGAGNDERVQCVVALAPWDVGKFGALLAAGTVPIAMMEQGFGAYVDPEAGPLHGTTARALLEEARDHADAWSFQALAPKLVQKRGLVLVSARDQARPDMLYAPLEAQLQKKAWTFRSIADDHGFSHHRIALARQILAWLAKNCP